MPTKARDVFGEIVSFPALMEAARKAAKGKRAKPGVAAFLANLEPEVLRLERELISGRYRPGRYKTIEIREPKRRTVSAAPFRDRVVHHAFCGIVEPLFKRGFIYDSYANRQGKGTHRAIARYERFRDRFRHVLRCDLYRFGSLIVLPERVLRGGSWNNKPRNLRAANRNRNTTGKRNNNNGFRIARTLEGGSRGPHGDTGRANERPGTVMMKNGPAFLLLRISGGGTPAAPVCKLSIIGWPHAGAFSDGLRVRCRVPRWRFQRA